LVRATRGQPPEWGAPPNPDLICVAHDSGAEVDVFMDDPTFGIVRKGAVSMPSGFEVAAMGSDDGHAQILVVANGVETSTEGESRLIRININHNTNSMWSGTTDISDDVPGNAACILFDAETNKLLIGCKDGSTEEVVVYDVEVERYSSGYFPFTLSEARTISGEVVPDYPKSAWRHGPRNGHLVYSYEDSTLHAIHMDSEEVSNTWICDLNASDASSGELPYWNGGSIYDHVQRTVVTACVLTEADYCRIWLDLMTATEVTLESIVESICTDCGLTSGQVEASALSDLVWGYILDNRTDGSSALQPLLDTYFFDVVDGDGKVKCVKRGGAVDETIPEADLACHESGADRPQELSTTRGQELELPPRLVVAYIDTDLAYESNVQYAERQVTDSTDVRAFSTPVAMDADAAAQVAEKRLSALWVGRTTHKLYLPRKYAYLEPSDVLEITEDGNTHRVRIEKVNYDGGVIELDVVDEIAGAYTSTATGEAPAVLPAMRDYTGPTHAVVADVPLLQAVNNKPGVMLGGMGYAPGWRGGVVEVSRDGGGSWQEWGRINSAAVLGKAATALPDVTDPWVWDEGGTVRVRLVSPDHTLSSDTRANVLDGANMAMLGDEMIQWRTATLGSDGSYTLSGLLRGRKGTEWATGTHSAGEDFLLVSAGPFAFVEFDADDINKELRFRARSFGALKAKLAPRTFTSSIRNMKPYAPAHVAGSRDGSNNLTLTWIRRPRYGGEWNDSEGVPLVETTEAYEVDVLDGSSVVRTIEVTTATASYTAAQQTSDGLTPGDPVDVIVYQVSSTIGRGYGTEATV
jgi:hypothetical protein